MATETTNPQSNETAQPAENTESVTTGKPTPAPQSPAAQHALAALMNREKAVRTQEAQVKAQAAELQRLQEQLRQQQNPEEVDPITKTTSELEQLRAELQQFKEQDEAYRNKLVLEEERSRVRSVLSEAEGLDAVKATGAYDTVFEHVLDHFNKTGEWISEAEAAQQINTQLLDLAKKLAPLVTQTSTAPPTQSMDMEEVARTLNQSMTSEASGTSSPETLSDAEINRRAAELLRFKLR